MLSFQNILIHEFFELDMNNPITNMGMRIGAGVGSSVISAKLNQGTQLDTMQKKHELQQQHNIENFQQQQQLNKIAASQQQPNNQQPVTRNNPNQPQTNPNAPQRA